MASTFKRTYYNPTTSGLDVAYTVPAVTTAIALSAIATPTNGVDTTVSVGIAPTGATAPNWISRNIPVANGSSVNLLPEKVTLTTGDRVVVNADVDLMQLVEAAITMPVDNPKSMAVNTAGTTILIAGDQGVAKSTDGGLTFNMVLAVPPTNSGFNLLRYFNSQFIYFASGTYIYSSSDGTTWTKVSGQVYPTSNVVGGTSKLVGINYGSLYESTNGTTWTSVVTRGLTTNVKTSAEINLNAAAFSNNRFVVVGDNGVTFVSFNNQPRSFEWSQVPTGVSDNLNGVAVAPGGSVCAVGDNGRILTINVSVTDSQNWSSQTSGTTENLKAIAWNTSASTYIVVGTGGTILTASGAGSTWTARTSGVTTTLNGVATFSIQNVIVGDSGVILTDGTGNGITWTSRTSGTSEHLYGTGFSSTMSLWYVVGANGTILTASSANLATWTSRTSGTSATLYTVAQAGSNFAMLIGGSGGTLLEADSKFSVFNVRPTKSNVTADILNQAYNSTTAPTAAILVGKTGTLISAGFETLSSIVGTFKLLDTQLTSGTSEHLNAVYWSSPDIVAVGNNGTILTSNSSLTTWTARTSGTSSNLRAVFKSGSVWVAVGDSGAVTVGNSGATTWANQTPISANHLYGLHLGPSSTGFITVGQGGVIFTGNAAGTTWTPQTNADTHDLFGVAYNSVTPNFIAVGGNAGTGRVLLGNSTATTWTVQTSGTTNILRAVAWVNNLFTAVGDSGTIITATNAGATWTARNSALTDNYLAVLNSTSIAGLSNITTISLAAAGVGGQMVVTSSSTVNFCIKNSSSTTQINGLTDTGAITVSVGNNGKIIAYTQVNGGWQEVYAFKPHEINGISSASTSIVAVGSGSMVYTEQINSSVRWNNLAWTTSPEMNLKDVTFNGTNHMFVGFNGSIGFQPNATTGNPTNVNTMTNTNLRGIAWNGSRHIIVGEDGEIYISQTAVTAPVLTKVTSGTSNNLNHIACNSSTLTVAVGDNGTILTSTGSGGTSWTVQTSGTSEHLYGVIYNSSANNFIAVGANGTILTSNTAGTTWTPRTSNAIKNLNAVYIGITATPVAVGDAGVILIGDRNGETWVTCPTVPVTHSLRAGTPAASGTINYVAGAGYTLMDMSDPYTPVIRSTFTQEFIPTAQVSISPPGSSTDRVAYVGNRGMIVQQAGRPGSTVYIPKFSGTYNNLRDIAVNSGSQVLVAVGDSGTFVSSLGGNSYGIFGWYNTSGFTGNFRGVGFGTTNFFAVGEGGIGGYAAGGLNGTLVSVNTGTTNNLYDCSYQSTGSTWAAVGAGGTIVTTATEVPASFTTRTSGTTNDLNSVVSSGVVTAYIAVGNNGTIVTGATSGTTWTVRTSGTTNNLIDAAVKSGTQEIVAVGDSGTYLTSSDSGTNWTAGTSGTTSNLVSVCTGGGSSGVTYTDTEGLVFTKTNYTASPVTQTQYIMRIAQYANTGAIAFATTNYIGSTSYTVNYVSPTKTLVANTKTSTTAITDITSVGDSTTNLFLVCQNTGNVQYTSDFVVYRDLGVTGQFADLVGNRVFIGTTDMISVPQSSVVSSALTANPVSAGPTLSNTLYFDRYNDVVLGINSSGQLWKIPDVTSTTPRGGVQFVVSVTEFT